MVEKKDYAEEYETMLKRQIKSLNWNVFFFGYTSERAGKIVHSNNDERAKFVYNFHKENPLGANGDYLTDENLRLETKLSTLTIRVDTGRAIKSLGVA